MRAPGKDSAQAKFLASSRSRDVVANYRTIPFSCSDPIVIAETPGGPILHNATGTFITFDDTTIFLVVNSHVLAAFRTSVEKHGASVFSIGEHSPLDPLSRIVYESPERDIALVDVSDIPIARRPSSLGPLAPHKISFWPPTILHHDDPVIFGGWIEKFRIQNKSNVEFVATPFIGLRVDDATQTFATVPFNRETYIASDGTLDNPILQEDDFSGMSGSPVFAVMHQPIEHFVLVGIVRDHLRHHDVLRIALLDPHMLAVKLDNMRSRS